jgi:hypothetical protein
VKAGVQRALYCRCGNEKILVLGLCATSYTLKRQNEECFGGRREEVLARDGYRCAVPGCTTLKQGKRSIAVHHRMPGISDPKLMIALCLTCHAKMTRTQYLRREWPLLLRVLWREQHPRGHEQTVLNFSEKTACKAGAIVRRGNASEVLIVNLVLVAAEE